ncbi:DNA topoisomerase [Basidiobolus ranarum]|uniref:DNA topoisomerase n=1 Tax=Basidiobolus ranarum TaxID=34480 RepID=A0ABR2X101_9FUNG
MTSLLGHLMTLDFGPNHKKWHSCPPLSLFEAPVFKSVNPDFKDIVMNLEREVRGASVLMIWTDCDREGENIGSEIVEICCKVNSRIRVLRAKFSVVMRRQVDAVDARTELDLRIGAAFTRFQTLKLTPQFYELDQKLISYGPCQFPTLGFIVDQFLRVENFVPEDFWKIEVSVNRDDGVATFKWKRSCLYDQLFCLVLYERCVENSQARVASVRSKPTSKWKPLPLTTVELQKSGARFLKMTSDRIMMVAESLYNRGFISYPRTETDQFESNFQLMPLIEKQTNDSRWGPYARRLMEGEFSIPRKGKNNDKAHPPIHPTAWAGNLTGDDKGVYEFIVRRFLAACSENAKGHETIVEINIADEIFTTKGLMIIARNYLEIYTYDHWNGNTIPVFTESEQFIPDSLEMSEGKSSPPSLLTEADLIAIMDKNGIGTDATIHEHIKKVLDREYAFKEDNYFVPSTLGIALVEGYDKIDFEMSLSKPFLRREMEINMKRICEGLQTKELVIRQGIGMYREVFIKSNDQWFKLVQALAKHFGHLPDEHGFDHVSRNSNGRGERRMEEGGEQGGGNLPFSFQTLPVGEPIPNCHCGLASACRTVRKEGVNQGRQFFCCIKPQGDDRCDFFQWIDDASFMSSNIAHESQSNLISTRAHNEQGNNDDPNLGISSHSNFVGDLNTPRCSCGDSASLRTVRKEGPNTGRQFYGCSKSQSQRCDFFQWDDEILPLRSENGNSSHGAEDNEFQFVRTNQFDGDVSNTTPNSNEPICDCGLMATLKTVLKKGPSKGKKFFTCAKSSQKCTFFQWLEDEGGISERGTSSISSGTSIVCYKCDQAGHLARNCPQSTDSTHKRTSGDHRCYTCNKSGHFANNCPKKVGKNPSTKRKVTKTKRPSISKSSRGKKRK